MGRRTILIIVIVVGVLLLAGAGIFFLVQQNQPQQAQPPAETIDGQVEQADGTEGETADDGGVIQLPLGDGSDGEPEDGPRNEVVVFLQTIPRGTLITKDNVDQLLTFDERLADTIDSTMVMTTTDVIGSYLRTDVYQGETVTTDVLAENLLDIAPNSYSPSSLIPTGFVGMGVPMDRLSSVAYGVSEGDFVDIMISFIFAEVDPQFQTLLQNSVSFYLESVDEEGNVSLTVVTVDPYGRFEELPTGDLALIQPSGEQQFTNVSMILQNAKVIQVGEFSPSSGVVAPTATPEAAEPVEGEEEATPTVPPAVTLTPTPQPNDVLVLALTPQQQLLLKYAIEAEANIDFALRGINDGQLYSVQNIDLNYLLERFAIEIPPNFNYTVDGTDLVTVTPSADTNEGGNEEDTTGEGQ